MKPSQDTDIPSSIIKENADIFANFLYFNYNNVVSDCKFPTSFQNANVLAMYKKDSELEEKIYRLISITLNLSKTNERIMHSQISAYVDTWPTIFRRPHIMHFERKNSRPDILILTAYGITPTTISKHVSHETTHEEVYIRIFILKVNA